MRSWDHEIMSVPKFLPSFYHHFRFIFSERWLHRSDAWKKHDRCRHAVVAAWWAPPSAPVKTGMTAIIHGKSMVNIHGKSMVNPRNPWWIRESLSYLATLSCLAEYPAGFWPFLNVLNVIRVPRVYGGAFQLFLKSAKVYSMAHPKMLPSGNPTWKARSVMNASPTTVAVTRANQNYLKTSKAMHNPTIAIRCHKLP